MSLADRVYWASKMDPDPGGSDWPDPGPEGEDRNLKVLKAVGSNHLVPEQNRIDGIDRIE